METLANPKKLLEDIRQLSENEIKIKNDEPELKSKQIFDAKYGINFIIVKHEYDIVIEKTLQLFCARNKILYINVPYLIYCHFYENDDSNIQILLSRHKKHVDSFCRQRVT